MSLWADYHRETENLETIEDADGFICFSYAPPFVQVHDLYVRPERRRTKHAWSLADRASARAKELGAQALWSKVWTGSKTADGALKANLAYGFKVIGAENGYIIMTKDLGGLNG